MFKTAKICLMAVGALSLALPCATPAGQGQPRYERTLNELRVARALLQRTNDAQAPNGPDDEVTIAIKNIDGAIAEISKDPGANGKKSNELPRVDSRMPWAKRLAESLKSLDKARQELGKEKNGSGDTGLQAQISDHIDQAHNRIEVAIETINFDYNARDMSTRND
jgi:hypothetical protein